VAYRPKAKLLESAKEEIGMRPAVEGDAEGVLLEYAPKLGKGREQPRGVVVADDALSLPVSAALIAHQIRRIGEHAVDGGAGKLRQEFQAVAVVDGDAGPVVVRR
jgi:hypothetical protein